MRRFSIGNGRRRQSTRIAVAGAAGVLLLAAAFVPASLAAAPVPNSGTATVDGATGDWSLAADFFADMTDGGDAAAPVRAKLYLKYDCDSETLAALVLTQGGEKARQDRPDNAYINIDGSKVIDSSHGSFAWVNGDGTLADGFEGAAGLAPGSYTLRAHVLVADDSADGYTPLDNVGRFVPLEIECGAVAPTQGTAPTPTGGAAPTQGAGPTQQPPTGGVAPTQGTRPAQRTLPPTDTLSVPGSSGPSGATVALVILGAVSFASLTLALGRRRRPVAIEVKETDERR